MMVLGDGRGKRLCKDIHREEYQAKISTTQKKVIHKKCGKVIHIIHTVPIYHHDIDFPQKTRITFPHFPQ
jgi:hypothetical protein